MIKKNDKKRREKNKGVVVSRVTNFINPILIKPYQQLYIYYKCKLIKYVSKCLL